MREPHVIDVPLHCDDRGFVYCALDNLDSLEIKRTYVVENFAAGRIRAFHGHMIADTYIHVIRGACKVVAAPILDNYIISDYGAISAVLSDRKPQLFFVPKKYANGVQSLTDNTKILVYSTLSFDEVKSDNVRFEWDSLGESFWEIKNR